MAKFRLATLLKLRERDRDMAANAVQEVRNAIEKLNEMKRSIDQSNEQMDDFRKNASRGAVDLQQILDAQRYQMVLSSQLTQIADRQGQLSQEMERRQIALVKSQQSVKALEKLRDQREDAATVHALAKQQERLDEWSSIRHAMNGTHDEKND